jgi:16S rRNA (guanine966-N2)-methyltransferase
MAEKVRGALFNILGDINGLTFLDAFAGGGALSIEAISRGAKSVTAVDNDKHASKAIRENIGDLQLSDSIKATQANVGGWSDNNQDKKFDVVLIDPPYNDVKHNLIKKIAAHANKDGIVAMSLPPSAKIDLPRDEYQLLIEKNYGDAELVFYKRLT